jgi:hypothetical protein
LGAHGAFDPFYVIGYGQLGRSVITPGGTQQNNGTATAAGRFSNLLSQFFDLFWIVL